MEVILLLVIVVPIGIVLLALGVLNAIIPIIHEVMMAIADFIVKLYNTIFDR